MKVIEWEPIKGFDGYFINELGEVKSVKSFKGTQEKILKGSKNQQGYKTISLMKNGKMYTKTLHRLLANTFIPNPNNLPCINHIDGNILNNSLDNLEWCTYGHNEKEAYRLGLKKSRIKPKKVIKLSKDLKILKIYDSLNSVKKDNYSVGNIGEVCNHNRKTAYGYVWRYADE